MLTATQIRDYFINCLDYTEAKLLEDIQNQDIVTYAIDCDYYNDAVKYTLEVEAHAN